MANNPYYPPPAYGDHQHHVPVQQPYGYPQGYPGAAPQGYGAPQGYAPPPQGYAAGYQYPVGQVPPGQAWSAAAPPAPMSDRPAKEQCFLIKSKASQQILMVEGASVDPGANIITAPHQAQTQDSQLWFEDIATGTIKSRLNLMCIDVQDAGPGFFLQKSPKSVPNGTVLLSNQTDGAGKLYSAVAHTQWGTIPGKAKGHQCWYAYSGKEYLTSDFSWVVAKVATLRNYPGGPPPGAMAVGHLTDGSGSQYAAIARSRWGTIPGRAQGNTCWFPHGGMEHFTSDFDWVVAENNIVVANAYVPGKPSQLWLRSGDRLQNRQDPSKVLQMVAAQSGSYITSAPSSNDSKQLWTFPSAATQVFGSSAATPSGNCSHGFGHAPVFTEPGKQAPSATRHQKSDDDSLGDLLAGFAGAAIGAYIKKKTRRYFHIRSPIHGKVVDVQGGNRNPGTMLIMWPQKGKEDNQLFYLDNEGIIRSKLTDFVLQPSGHGIWMQPYNKKPNQQWTIRDNKIVNKNSGNCIEISGGNRNDGAILSKGANQNVPRQNWSFDYI